MNINTKALLAGTILTALFSSTSVMADDIGFDVFENFDVATTEVIEMQKVRLQAVVVDSISEGTNR